MNAEHLASPAAVRPVAPRSEPRWADLQAAPDTDGRRRRCLAAGVVPAVAAPAHRCFDAVLGQHVAQVLAGVLAAPAAVGNRPGLLAGMALEPRHAQRIDDDLALHVLARPPADHLAAEQVGDHRQEQPAFVGGDVGVKSPALTLSGSATVNSRASRLGAISKSWLLSVVTLKRRLPFARMPSASMSFRTRYLLTRMPLASSFLQVRSQP